MAPRYEPGAATAAALKAANRAHAEAEKAHSKSSTSSLRPPSPSGSRNLCPRSPQSNRADPGFVSQPRDSRLAVVSPLRQSSTSQTAIEVLDDDPTSDHDEDDKSSPSSSDDEEDEGSSSAELTASQSGGKRKKKKRKVSKKKKGKDIKGKGRAKSKKKCSQIPKALAKVVNNNSDIEMISKPKKKQPGQAKQTLDGTELLFTYYGEPDWDSDNPDDDEPKLYPCNFCGKVYRDGTTNHFNLKGHRDGAIGRRPCQSREKAIAAGFKLPPTYQEEEEAKKKAAEQIKGTKSSLLDMFLEIPKFMVRLLNCILVLWLVRQALPWNRLVLIAAFQFANPSAVLYTPAWAAREAMKVYKGVHNDVIKRLQDLPGKFCLIHDVWTTKHGRRAFIGVSVSYIDKHWKFHVHHLTLKLVAWNHYGALLARPVGRFLIRHKLHKKMVAQTTDSGSSNNLTAKELEDMFLLADDPVYWDSSRHQIRCYAHKLALTVKAGLASIKVKSGTCKPTAPTGRKLALLLPDLPKNHKPPPTIILNDGDAELEDGDEDIEDSEDTQLEKCVGDDESEVDDDEVEATEIASGDPFSKAIHKCSKINKIIARNGPLMQLFHAIAREESYTGPGLIAAHGQRWNIFLDMLERLMKAKKIVNRMLNEDEDNNFDGVFISPEDWKMVEALSNVLQIFYSSTKCMEGDAPNAGSVLFQYSTIIGALKDIRSNTSYSRLAAMIRVMIVRLEDYQAEALHCHAIIMATILNPKFRGKFFEKLFPEQNESAHEVLKSVYDKLLQDNPPATSPAPKVLESEPQTHNIFKERNVFASQAEAEQPGDAELQAYLSGKYMCDDNQDILDWWACHEQHFPNLASLARDYLCCVGTSCACERTFSAAADVITADRGGLASRTIERAVGLCEWLKKHFVPPGDYGEAMRMAEKIMGRQKKGKKTL